ncbi:ChrR family anti-sigma-E factor [Aliidiomarina haloalkalitolerans]|uniref:Transcriptional regulator n=1 Tax=Aliidiomarina haloalkalitolerans TaxID=859059 RepID=A0A432VYM2_9GAMM|nr:ChrR family anti-sigma-E factor [Aliidiomarina haloalkalitolerans]RUO21758.1 transcriptional regulator [Aliidiomarina haloalkalitolerans]
MIKFHPNEELLVQYVQGNLDSALAVVVGTHIDMCQHCKAHARDIETHLSAKELGASTDFSELTMQAMLEDILNSAAPAISAPQQILDKVTVEGKQFRLPPALKRVSHRLGDWSKVPGSVWRAPLKVDDHSAVNLIYMGAGASVPEHTHRQHEATLVINGTFNDEHDRYHDGDFVFLGADHRHSPQTAEEDCLTLAWLDAPLQFTSGMARLLNPFSSLFFK